MVAGDAASRRDVATAMAGQDAVVSALGRGNSVVADGLFTRSSAAVIAAAEETDLSRLVWLSPFGVGHTLTWSSPAQKLIYRTLLRSIYRNKETADDSIRSSRLDWTLVYPTRLTHGPATGTYRADDRLPMRGNPTISRADVAAFMHRAAHNGDWIHCTAVISDRPLAPHPGRGGQGQTLQI